MLDHLREFDCGLLGANLRLDPTVDVGLSLEFLARFIVHDLDAAARVHPLATRKVIS